LVRLDEAVDAAHEANTGGLPLSSQPVAILFGPADGPVNAKAVLDTQVVDLAATFGSAYMRISGNTDTVGSREANVRLSKARADAVTRFLVTKGFDRNKFEVVGNGPDKPVAERHRRGRAGTGAPTSRCPR
jgi:outer membrane protein OmpA-like peptidoglycan-associated protein